jgi:nucleoside-diphosphate-sugar epimerase
VLYHPNFNMNNFWTKKRVLVTGSNGFIGSHIIRKLHTLGASISAQFHHDSSNTTILPGVKYVKADLTNAIDCLNVMHNQDIVFHFAAVDGGHDFKLQNQTKIFHDNNLITLNILESAAITNVKRVLLTSSIEIYSNLKKIKVKEDDVKISLKKNFDSYSWTKFICEIAASIYQKQSTVNIAIARMGRVYGQDEDIHRGRLIPTLINNILSDKKITLYGKGSQQLSFLYIEDAVQALIQFAEHNDVSGPLNICGDEYFSIIDIANKIYKITGKKKNIQYIQDIVPESPHIIVNKKAKQLIGFAPKYTFDQGLQLVISEYAKQLVVY